MQTAALLTPKPELGHRLIDINEVKQKMGWRSDATVYSWIADRGFPKPLKGSAKCARWILAEVDRFIEALPRGVTGENPVKKKAAS